MPENKILESSLKKAVTIAAGAEPPPDANRQQQVTPDAAAAAKAEADAVAAAAAKAAEEAKKKGIVPPKKDEPGEKKPAPIPGVPDDVVAIRKDGDLPEKDEDEDEDDPIPDRITKEDAIKWRTSKNNKIKELKATIKTLETRAPAADVGGGDGDGTEVEQLKQTITEKDNLIGQFSLAHTEAFRTKYEAPIQRKLEEIRMFARNVGLDDKLIDQAVALEPRKRGELLTEAAAGNAPTILAMFAGVDLLVSDRNTEIMDWQKNAPKYQQAQQDKNTSQMKQVVQAASTKALATVAGDLFLFRKTAGQGEEGAKWNQAVEARMERARTIVEHGDVEQQAELMIRGIAAEELLAKFMTSNERVLELESEIEERFAAKPRISSSPPEAKTKRESLTSTGDIGKLVSAGLARKR